MSLSRIESIVESLAPFVTRVTAGVESPGTIVVRVEAPGRPDDLARLRDRLGDVLARTIEQPTRVEVKNATSGLGGPVAR